MFQGDAAHARVVNYQILWLGVAAIMFPSWKKSRELSNLFLILGKSLRVVLSNTCNIAVHYILRGEYLQLMPKGERVLHGGVVNKDLYNARCVDNFVRVAGLACT